MPDGSIIYNKKIYVKYERNLKNRKDNDKTNEKSNEMKKSKSYNNIQKNKWK